MTTTNTINTDIKVLDKSITVKNAIRGRRGTYRAITKINGFFTTVTRNEWENIYDVFSTYIRKGVLQTIEFTPEDSNISVIVFAMKGKKCIVMDKELAEMITIGDVCDSKGAWSSTNLYNQEQIKTVNASSWSSKVFVVNE